MYRQGIRLEKNSIIGSLKSREMRLIKRQVNPVKRLRKKK